MNIDKIERTAKNIILEMALGFGENAHDWSKIYETAYTKFQTANIEMTKEETETMINVLKSEGYICEHPSMVRITQKGKQVLDEGGFK